MRRLPDSSYNIRGWFLHSHRPQYQVTDSCQCNRLRNRPGNQRKIVSHCNQITLLYEQNNNLNQENTCSFYGSSKMNYPHVTGYRYIAHLYCLAVQAGFYSDVVECSLGTRENLVRSPSGEERIFLRLLHLAPNVN